MKRENALHGESLRFWLVRRGMSQHVLALKVGVAPNTISQIATGQRNPSLDLLEKITGALDLSLPEFFACKDGSLPEIVFVERVKARPRGGGGGLETDAECSGLYSFHSSFIARKRGSAEDMKIFEVAGDSMSPTLNDGDLIMVNLRETDVRGGYVYLLRMGDELMVKRLENRPGNRLLIRSDNPAYEAILISKDSAGGEVQIYGRMVWSCREY